MFYRQLAPALVSAFGLALCAMADAIVVGQDMGVVGLAAIGIALPIFMVMNVVLHSFGIGGSIAYTNLMAKGQTQEAKHRMREVFTAVVGVGIIMAVFGLVFIDQFLAILGSIPSDGEVFEAAKDYLGIILAGIPLMFAAYILNYYLRSDDFAKEVSIGFTIGNVTDILLNIVLVLGFKTGVTGAALATVLGHCVTLVFYVIILVKKQHNLSLKPVMVRLAPTIKQFTVGFTSTVHHLFNFIFLIVANRLLLLIAGHEGVAIFDVIQNTAFLVMYMYDAVNRATQPLYSTYYGERNDKARLNTLKLGMIWGNVIGLIVVGFIAIFPGVICAVFGLSSNSEVAAASYALRVYSISGMFAGLSVLLQSYYQACERERYSLLLSIFRGAVFLFPTTIIFSFYGINSFWWLFPVTEILSVALFFLFRFRKTNGGMIRTTEAGRVLAKTFTSKNEELAPLIAEIEEFCERFEATPKQSYFVTMSVEELCSVIMSQGFSGDSGYIEVTLICDEEGGFELHIRDDARSFNPFTLYTDKASEDGDFDMDAMGVMVIKKQAKEFYYRRYQNFNNLVVKI